MGSPAPCAFNSINSPKLLNSIQQRLAAIQAYAREPGPLRLQCGIQHYDWGAADYIPMLLGRQNPQGKPHAELWIGAHPELPSTVLTGDREIPLNELIAEIPEVVLGAEVSSRFEDRLPFLLKILSAQMPLSIQAHPNRDQAMRGFARENRQGIPLSDRGRNYKDDNHKPELIAALTDFYALRGFRDPLELATALGGVAELEFLLEGFETNRDGLRGLYSRIMALPQAEVDHCLGPLIERLSRDHRRQPFSRDQREYWVLEADRHFSRGQAPRRRDRGIFSIFLLNLIRMQPGQAMYLPAGELHAYLYGNGVEIMANSNNVLRGGLTPKHVDVPELLATLEFTSGPPEILTAEVSVPGSAVRVFRTPVQEFELAEVTLEDSATEEVASGHEIHIGIVLQGLVELHCGDRQWCFERGEAFLVPAGIAYRLLAQSPAVVFRASVP